MVEWKLIENAARDFLKANKLKEAEEVIAFGLKSFPNQINLLIVASDVYRASGNYMSSLEQAKLLVKHYPHQPSGYIRSAQDLIDSGEELQAQKAIEDGINIAPNNLHSIVVSREIFRRSGIRDKCLEYSYALIIYHPNDWRGYGRAAQDLIALRRYKEAQAIIHLGLERLPHQADLLNIASNIYRQYFSVEKSLDYAELLMAHHPGKWQGYARSAQGLIALKRYNDAKAKIQTSLIKFPHQIQLKKYLAYTNRFQGIINQNLSDAEKQSISLNEIDLITYSSMPNFFELIQQKRGEIGERSKTSQNYVFVAGLGRSGTSALGRLLNQSSMIAIYHELHSPFRIDGYSISDLSKTFVSRNLKTHQHKNINSDIFAKSLNSKIVGDKRPYFQFCAESTFDNLGVNNTMCLFIDRSLVDICRSSHARSVCPDDLSWPREQGVEHTILMYNASCRQIIYLHDKRPDIFSSFLFPAYEDIFSSEEKAIQLFNFCGIRLSEDETIQVKKFVKESRKHTKTKVDPSDSLEIYIRTSISNLLDHESHERFCIITGNHRIYPKP